MHRRAKSARPTAVIPTLPAQVVLLNDPSFVEAARALASRLLTRGDRRQRAASLGLAAGAGPRCRREESELLAKLLHQPSRFYI